MTTKKLMSAVWGVALALGLASAPASALTFYFPFTTFEDNDLDFVVDTNSNGIIDVGDRLVSVLEFQTTQGVLTGQGPTSVAPGTMDRRTSSAFARSSCSRSARLETTRFRPPSLYSVMRNV